MSARGGRRALAVLGIAGAAAACNGASSKTPVCECVCPPCSAAAPAAAAAQSGAPSPIAPAPVAAAGDLGELVASASRKMFHDDGPGCLADLDLVARADPLLAGRLAAVRGQCEMLAGRCQDGKRRISAHYREEMSFTQERADAIAEQIGSMRCRGGDASPRDELLRAYFELSDAAYVNRRDPAYCRQRVDAARRLAPLVPPGPDDAQLDGSRKALFHTAASCFAKAGDCAGAFAAYHDNYPVDALSAIKAPAQRLSIVKDSFRSSFPACKGVP